MKYFKKDNVYPYEAFIQEAIEEYFKLNGYVVEKEGQIDLIAEKGKEKWIVEAKGMTSQTKVDFNTCLGQLVKSMSNPKCNYAIALPQEEKYKTQCLKIPDFFRTTNNLYFLLVDNQKSVINIGPEDDVEENWRKFNSTIYDIDINVNKDEILELLIKDLNFSAKTNNALLRLKVCTLGDLTRVSKKELMSTRNFNEAAMKEVLEVLKDYGIKLKDTV